MIKQLLTRETSSTYSLQKFSIFPRNKIAMETFASPAVENLPKKEVEESKGTTDISGSEEHDDCYVIGFTDDDDEDEDYCYVIDHSNHGEDYLSHCEVIADEGYDDGDEDESDYDDEVTDDDCDEYEDDSDDDSCYEIDPTEFSQKISLQVPDDALAT